MWKTTALTDRSRMLYKYRQLCCCGREILQPAAVGLHALPRSAHLLRKRVPLFRLTASPPHLRMVGNKLPSTVPLASHDRLGLFHCVKYHYGTAFTANSLRFAPFRMATPPSCFARHLPLHRGGLDRGKNCYSGATLTQGGLYEWKVQIEW